ncbi:MAG: thioredoxin family protein [Chitinophagaceae bacterium]
MNKKYFYNFIVVLSFSTLLFSCSSTQKIDYTTVQNGNEKYLRGVINKNVLNSDSNYIWLARDMKYIRPNNDAVAIFNQQKTKFSLIVFGGTWCEDTQNLLPKFYKLIEKSEFPEKKVLLIAVDRDKQTINNLHQTYKITQVPTFIVMQGNKEIGRVVEYGKYNDIEKELAEIVSKL